MYINEKLKLNKFRLVNIPENKDYFSRYGFLQMPDTAYSGDEETPLSGRKIDDIEFAEAYDRMMQKRESEQPKE